MAAGKAAAGQASAAEAKSPATTGPGPMYVLKDQVVNLADPSGRRYLKIGLSIEFSTGAAEFKKASPDERKAKQAEFDKALEPEVPLINDAIISLLSARSPADLSTPEGKERLKNDIKDALNRILGGDQVSNVYFTQFVMQ
jgi:flagellar FliL protein